MGQELAGGYLDSCSWQNATGDTTWGNANAKDRQVDSCWRGPGLEKMHVSSVEDTIRPEIFEAPLRSAQSFWNPFKAPASDSGDQTGLCATLVQRYICLLTFIFPGCIGPGTFFHPELAQSVWVWTTMTHRDMTSTHLLPMFAFQGCCCSYKLRQLSSVILSIPTHYSCTITIWPFCLWYIH